MSRLTLPGDAPRTPAADAARGAAEDEARAALSLPPASGTRYLLGGLIMVRRADPGDDAAAPRPVGSTHATPNEDPRVSADAESWDPLLPPVQGDPRRPSWPHDRARDPAPDEAHHPTGPEVG